MIKYGSDIIKSSHVPFSFEIIEVSFIDQTNTVEVNVWSFSRVSHTEIKLKVVNVTLLLSLFQHTGIQHKSKEGNQSIGNVVFCLNKAFSFLFYFI